MAMDTSEAGPLTPAMAVDEIRRIETLHGALARRTTGLTWMIWGVVAPAVFVTDALATLAAEQGALPFAAFPFLWVPWAALGLLATASLWRSVGLVIPVDRTRCGRAWFLTGAVIVALIAAGILAIRLTGAPVAELAGALAGLGIAAAVLGAAGVNSTAPGDRRLWVAGGALMALVALAGSLLAGGDLVLARAAFAVISPVTSGLVFFGGGLVLVSRA